MNGVIHNCSHGAGTDHNTRLTEEEMMVKVFNYLDHLVQMMQPQKLLYMAIDGVAPRAKARKRTRNQSRRYTVPGSSSMRVPPTQPRSRRTAQPHHPLSPDRLVPDSDAALPTPPPRRADESAAEPPLQERARRN